MQLVYILISFYISVRACMNMLVNQLLVSAHLLSIQIHIFAATSFFAKHFSYNNDMEGLVL